VHLLAQVQKQIALTENWAWTAWLWKTYGRSIARSDSENFEQAVLTTDVAEQNSLINFVLVGGGPTGEELGSFGQMKSYSEKIIPILMYYNANKFDSKWRQSQIPMSEENLSQASENFWTSLEFLKNGHHNVIPVGRFSSKFRCALKTTSRDRICRTAIYRIGRTLRVKWFK
jgi:hypothetical protein